MRRAILSDIHGNFTALQAVLRDVAAQNCDEIICLGDVVGYGPEPQKCVDEVAKFDACILGNHDLAALFDPEGFSSAAEQAIMWTRKQLEASDTPENCRRRLEFLSRLPRVRREGNTLFVHGSVRNPINEYVFPEDIHNRRKMEKLFSMIQKVCFQGHTHVPGVFTSDMKFFQADAFPDYQIADDKIMVNVGSVGQPRDGNPHSCYVVLEEPWVHFRRVEYDVADTAGKIYAISELDRFLGDRLFEGK